LKAVITTLSMTYGPFRMASYEITLLAGRFALKNVTVLVLMTLVLMILVLRTAALEAP